MKRILRDIKWSSFVVLLSFGLVSQAQEIIPGEYIVKYKGSGFMNSYYLNSFAGAKVESHNSVARTYKMVLNPIFEKSTVEKLKADQNIEYVVPNFKLHAMFVSSRELVEASIAGLQSQWALQKIRASDAWSRVGNRGSKKITVAVIDTGVDHAHTMLKSNMVPGYDFKGSDQDPMDETSAQNPGHGTHCAGIIGANGLIDDGVVGISPLVSIMPLRFLGADGSGDLNNAIKAVDYAIQKNVDIISASWGAAVSRSMAQPLIEAVERASNAGVIFVVAAANDGKNNDQTEVFPANASTPNTISVAASGPNDEKPSWSNFGLGSVHVAAPGLDIMSTLPSGKIGKLSGTSMATPLVSGLVALLKAQDPSLTGSEIKAILQKTGVQTQIEVACRCRIDALGAVEAVLNQEMLVIPMAATVKKGETLNFLVKNGQSPFRYSVADASIGSVDSSGVFTAQAAGETQVTVVDAGGQTLATRGIRVVESSGGGGGGGDQTCPLGDPQTCQMICGIIPDLPWCTQ